MHTSNLSNSWSLVWLITDIAACHINENCSIFSIVGFYTVYERIHRYQWAEPLARLILLFLAEYQPISTVVVVKKLIGSHFDKDIPNLLENSWTNI